MTALGKSPRRNAQQEEIPAFLHEKGFIGILQAAASTHRDKIKAGLQLLGLSHWSLTHLAVLSRLFDVPMSQADIAKFLHISPPSAMEFVKRLESEGYVTRHRDPNDARRRLVTITPAARIHIEDIRRHFSASMDSSEAQLWERGFTQEDMERCKALLSAYTELSRTETKRLQARFASGEQHGVA